MQRKRITLQILAIAFTILVAAVLLVGCTKEAEDPPGGDPAAGIQVFFKLDPRLLGPTYGGERWVSPTTYGPVLASETPYAIEARAEASGSEGQRQPATLEWVPENPEMVTVSPGEGDQVTINIQRPGESNLVVKTQGLSITLKILAEEYRNSAIQLAITQ